MELHPFLEHRHHPQQGLWYVLSSCSGKAPSCRVGHTCTYAAAPDSSDDPVRPRSSGAVYVFGGANPDEAFAELHKFNLDTFAWTQSEMPASVARYEHSAALLGDKILIFGGATKSHPLSDVLSLCLDTNTGTPHVCDQEVSPRGRMPAARTQHSNGCLTECGLLIVFSGGGLGSEPVTDRQVYLYDPTSFTWSVVSTCGTPPKPRLGHLMIYRPPSSDDSQPAALDTPVQQQPRQRHKNRRNRRSPAPGPNVAPSESGTSRCGRLYVHGGMTGCVFYDDLYQLEFRANKEAVWSEVPNPATKRRDATAGEDSDTQLPDGRPCARAAHGGALLPDGVTCAVFGGMSRCGALHDLYIFNTDTYQWTRLECGGPPPPPRLDFGCCVVTLRLPLTELDTDSRDRGGADQSLPVDTGDAAASADSQAMTKCLPSQRWRNYTLLFVHGGMDTAGEVFDDVMVYLLQAGEEEQTCGEEEATPS